MRNGSRRLLWAGVTLLASLGAGVLALRRGDIPYEDLERRYGGRSSRYVRAPGGIRVHYRDDGPRDAPVLVLLHGFAASALDWEPWIQHLVPRYRVISVDLPGHGLTAAPPGLDVTIRSLVDLVGSVADRLGLGRFVLIGNSLGGRMACAYALRHPGRLDGLVLINAVSTVQRPGSAPSPIFRLLASGLGRMILRRIDLTPLVRRSLAVAFHDKRLVTPALVARYVDLARAPGHRDILTTLQMEGDEGLLGQMAAIGVPTLVMVGEADRLVSAADSRRVAQAIPGADLIVYPDVGHVPMQQIPDRSAGDLDTWIRANALRD